MPQTPTSDSSSILGLATAIYNVPDMPRAKAWYVEAFRQQPYFDEPFYVGFNVGGYELGLVLASENKSGPGGATAYWRVASIEPAVGHFLAKGATSVTPVEDVGGGIKLATVADPFGNVIGLIENPHFKL